MGSIIKSKNKIKDQNLEPINIRCVMCEWEIRLVQINEWTEKSKLKRGGRERELSDWRRRASDIKQREWAQKFEGNLSAKDEQKNARERRVEWDAYEKERIQFEASNWVSNHLNFNVRCSQIS